MTKLRKELSLFQATFIGIGVILGAGIYVLIGKGAGIAGDSLWLSFSVAAVIAAFTGLSYAELSAMFPRASAEYVYMKRAFNRRSVAFLIQWIMVFALVVGSSTVALGFGGYFFSIFGISPLIAAAGLILAVSIINYKGIRESSRFNILATSIEITGLVIVIIIGIFFIPSANLDLLAAPSGLTGILSATALIFFAYIGFENIVNLSEETKKARKIIPKALIISLAVTTGLYILVAISSVAVVGSVALAESGAPLTDVVAKAVPQGGLVMSIIALFATANTALAFLLVASRMLYGLSTNNELPAVVGKVGKGHTPYVAVLIAAVLSLAILSLGGIKTIALLADIGVFIVYISINTALIVLRYKAPHQERSFRLPLNIGRFPVLALIGILTSGLMLLHFEAIFLVYEISVVLAGYAFYKAFRTFREK